MGESREMARDREITERKGRDQRESEMLIDVNCVLIDVCSYLNKLLYV